MVGEREAVFVDAKPPVPATAGDAVLSVANLSGAGFRDISFSVGKGEILGFGGLHGQGQSSVLRAISGALAHNSGAIHVGGKPCAARTPAEAIRNGIAYVSGDRGRDGTLTGRPILENVTPIHFLRNGLHLARPGALTALVDGPLKALKTKFQDIGQPVNSLSGGNQQKVVIARWLVDRPSILLLDDPTKGIDLAAKSDLFQLIRSLAADGMGIVLYSSEDAELLANADRILVFNSGAVTRELKGEDRTRYNLYHAAYEAA